MAKKGNIGTLKNPSSPSLVQASQAPIQDMPQIGDMMWAKPTHHLGSARMMVAKRPRHGGFAAMILDVIRTLILGSKASGKDSGFARIKARMMWCAFLMVDSEEFQDKYVLVLNEPTTFGYTILLFELTSQ
jgi:hypothetical protein